jgi:hypothetical protein
MHLRTGKTDSASGRCATLTRVVESENCNAVQQKAWHVLYGAAFAAADDNDIGGYSALMRQRADGVSTRA